MDLDQHRQLIEALVRSESLPCPVDAVTVIETHISTILLAGESAFKIKKPVDFGFLDFSTLEQRRHFCHEEIRLNGRLAPAFYLDVVAIGGTTEEPRLTDDEAGAIEFAVRMVRFPNNSGVDQLLTREEITPAHIDQIADTIAHFQQEIAHCPATLPFGSPVAAMAPVRENFNQIKPLLKSDEARQKMQLIQDWSEQQYTTHLERFQARKAGGFTREGHGDMHLGNMVLIDDAVVIFDGIEFNDAFRWIDVISELAFLVMDLMVRKRSDYAYRLLNRWLERSGDFEALPLLPFYLSYRAMVRAKIDRLRLSQIESGPEAEQLYQDYHRYVELAAHAMPAEQPPIIITYGFSGSGKSLLSQILLEHFGAIRIRSDVERKRLFELEAHESSHSKLDGGIYTADASARTYTRLLELTESISLAGYPVIVDATFLKEAQRQPFAELADRLGHPFVILHASALPETLRYFVAERHAAGTDASEADLAVLEHQLNHNDPLTEQEKARTVVYGTGKEIVVPPLISRVTQAITKQQL